MLSTAYFIGAPQDFNSFITIYPPSINDTIYNKQFWQCYKSLTLSQEELDDEVVKQNKDAFVSPFEFLLINSYYSSEYYDIVREAFRIFCHTEIAILFELKKIVIGDLEKLITEIKDLDELNFLEEKDFFKFQNAIRECIGDKIIEPPDPDEDPRVKRIKAKARYRDKIKAQKGLNLHLTSSLAAICCMGMGLNPLNIGEISYASINTLISMYQARESYDINIRSIQAGADAKKVNPVYWIKNLDN